MTDTHIHKQEPPYPPHPDAIVMRSRHYCTCNRWSAAYDDTRRGATLAAAAFAQHAGTRPLRTGEPMTRPISLDLTPEQAEEVAAALEARAIEQATEGEVPAVPAMVGELRAEVARARMPITPDVARPWRAEDADKLTAQLEARTAANRANAAVGAPVEYMGANTYVYSGTVEEVHPDSVVVTFTEVPDVQLAMTYETRHLTIKPLEA